METETLLDAVSPALRKQWKEQAERNQKIAEQMRLECAQAIALLADAIRNPQLATSDLEEASTFVLKALSHACVLQPE